MAKADSNYVKKKTIENLIWRRFKKDTENLYDSTQYHTARNLTLRSIILRGTRLRAVSYCGELRKNMNISGENETNNKTVLTHWSVAHAGSN